MRFLPSNYGIRNTLDAESVIVRRFAFRKWQVILDRNPRSNLNQFVLATNSTKDCDFSRYNQKGDASIDV